MRVQVSLMFKVDPIGVLLPGAPVKRLVGGEARLSHYATDLVPRGADDRPSAGRLYPLISKHSVSHYAATE